jgi:hypothetical protein
MKKRRRGEEEEKIGKLSFVLIRVIRGQSKGEDYGEDWIYWAGYHGAAYG